MRISDLCDYSDLCIAVKGVITIEDTDDADKRKKKSNLQEQCSVR